jgi:uncharacterized repeat protein (TIGR01451 family)
LANLSITKVDNAGGSSITSSVGNVTPGQSLIYTIVVHNSGTASATNTSITDPIPADLTSDTWTATQTGGASGFSASGTGNINQTGATLPAGSSITYTVTGLVSPTATGTFSNTATVTPSGCGSANPRPTPIVSVCPIFGLPKPTTPAVRATRRRPAASRPARRSPTWSTSATQARPQVSGVSVTDPIPANITGATWTATESGGASGYAPTGSGNIANTVTLPAGSYIKYVVTGTVSPTATGSISNTATATPHVGAQECDRHRHCELAQSGDHQGRQRRRFEHHAVDGQRRPRPVADLHDRRQQYGPRPA